MFEQAPSYRAPKWALVVRLMQKEWLKKAPAVENFAWLPVGAVSVKSGRGLASLI